MPASRHRNGRLRTQKLLELRNARAAIGAGLQRQADLGHRVEALTADRGADFFFADRETGADGLAGVRCTGCVNPRQKRDAVEHQDVPAQQACGQAETRKVQSWWAEKCASKQPAARDGGVAEAFFAWVRIG